MRWELFFVALINVFHLIPSVLLQVCISLNDFLQRPRFRMVQTSSNIFEASTTPQRNRREKQKPATFSLSVEPSFTSQGEVIPSKPSMFFQTQTPTHHLSRETLPLQLCAIVFIFCPSPQFVVRL